MKNQTDEFKFYVPTERTKRKALIKALESPDTNWKEIVEKKELLSNLQKSEKSLLQKLIFFQ